MASIKHLPAAEIRDDVQEFESYLTQNHDDDDAMFEAWIAEHEADEDGRAVMECSAAFHMAANELPWGCR